jgi:hypothetical protein
MGNFYGNITLATNDPTAVETTLRDLRRDAYVSAEDGFVVVFDSIELETKGVQRLLSDLSQRLNCVGLAVMNADDDELVYLLADRGRVVDEYDSNPGYGIRAGTPPTGGDARRLCAAFSEGGSELTVRAILHGPSPVFEVDRHQALVNTLGLPPCAVGMGYGYIAQGDAEEVGLTDLRRIGAAPEP